MSNLKIWSKDIESRLAGTLLGTALGDALGLVAEGLSSHHIRYRFGTIERFHLIGNLGFVSDDTEQAALLAQSLAKHPTNSVACVSSFRRALIGWFLRLPPGLGKATMLSCIKMSLGIVPSGVFSAGNGAAMRAAIIGTFFHGDPQSRLDYGKAIAQLTHSDPRAIAAALYVAELAAACTRHSSETSTEKCFSEAYETVENVSLRTALWQAHELASQSADTEKAANLLNTSGFVLHSIPFATFCFLRYGHQPLQAFSESILAGGDTDSNSAILGAWIGALKGDSSFPQELITRIHDGPFGPTHLRQLAACLAAISEGSLAKIPQYSWPYALLRNIWLMVLILWHAVLRLKHFVIQHVLHK